MAFEDQIAEHLCCGEVSHMLPTPHWLSDFPTFLICYQTVSSADISSTILAHALPHIFPSPILVSSAQQQAFYLCSWIWNWRVVHSVWGSCGQQSRSFSWVQSVAARLLMHPGRQEHITEVLQHLSWLHIVFWTWVKVPIWPIRQFGLRRLS